MTMREENGREWRERMAPLAPRRSPDWQALHERILARARPLLEARRRAARERVESAWLILARWARPGLATAAVGLLLLFAWLRAGEPPGRPTLEEALRPLNGEPATAVVLAVSEPNTETVARLVLEPSR